MDLVPTSNPNSLKPLICCAVVRASVPRMILDEVFEQKNDIARAVSEELEKVSPVIPECIS